MQENNELEYIEVGRMKLTERSLNGIVARIKERYGLEVTSIEETKEGYVFKGKHGFTIGDVTYNTVSRRYDAFNFHHGVIESIAAKDREIKLREAKEQRRKYNLQKNIRLGVAITAAGIIALTTIGIIRHQQNNVQQPEIPDNQVVAEVGHLNTLKSADDLILLEWANYAMSGLGDVCESSEYESFRSIKNDVYANMFVPIMTNYYNYLDMIDSGLPQDIVGESIERSHKSFRTCTEQFNTYLGEQYFSEFTFENSPYADAVVMDQSGHVISGSGDYHGELQDETGKVITYESETIKVYIKATSIPNQKYTLENLPTDAILYNGDAYILTSHLYGDLSQGMNK